MRHVLQFITAGCVLLLCLPAICRADDLPDIAGIVDSIGQSSAEADNAVGLSIGVALSDSAVYTAGFGLANVELDVPATADTVYRIGSISKEFTAAAVMLLVEGGEIQLTDPLSKFLSDLPMPVGAVTIRHLLQHTSGVHDFTRLPTYRRDRQTDVTPDEVLDRFQNLPLDFEPGEQHQYCNSGYFLLGLVIEESSGQSFREFVENRLFAPLELDQTYCDNHFRIIPSQATGYSHWAGRLRTAAYVNINQSVGAGNLASNVGDLLVWQRGLVNGRLLSAESTELVLTTGELTSGKRTDYGLGVFIRKLEGHRVIRHGGGISGFRADVAHYPDSGITIAILANCDKTNTARISDRIARELFSREATDEPADN